MYEPCAGPRRESDRLGIELNVSTRNSAGAPEASQPVPTLYTRAHSDNFYFLLATINYIFDHYFVLEMLVFYLMESLKSIPIPISPDGEASHLDPSLPFMSPSFFASVFSSGNIPLVYLSTPSVSSSSFSIPSPAFWRLGLLCFLLLLLEEAGRSFHLLISTFWNKLTEACLPFAMQLKIGRLGKARLCLKAFCQDMSSSRLSYVISGRLRRWSSSISGLLGGGPITCKNVSIL